MLFLWIPLIVAFSIPALVSWILKKFKAKIASMSKRKRRRFNMTQHKMKERVYAAQCFDAESKEEDHIESARSTVTSIQRKIAETEADDAEDNIRTLTQHKLKEMLVHRLRPHEIEEREQRVIALFAKWNRIMDSLLRMIKENAPALRQRIVERKLQELLIQDLYDGDDDDDDGGDKGNGDDNDNGNVNGSGSGNDDDGVVIMYR